MDHRSLYVQISILNKQVESVCDSGASVSCLSEELFNQINENHQVKIQPSTTRLSSANQMPIQIKGTVSVPIKIGPKPYEHTFYVLIEAASDCLLGLDFLETNKCDALFSERKLKIDRNTLVPLYRKQFSFDEKQVYRVVALEKVSIPPQHVMIVPGTIPGWKAPPVARVALFEPHERFMDNEDQIAQDALFSFGKGIVPITIANTNDEVLTIYKDTTLGSSQLVSDRLIQETNKTQMKNYNEVDPKYDLENVTKAISKEINNNCRADFRNLIDDYSDICSMNQWDLGKCDANSHRIDVKPGSQPIKLPNRRMPVQYKDDLKEKIDAFMNKELITPCHSPYSAPAMLVPKKNGKLRLVIDYRKLNEQTIKSCWPIPSIEEIFDTLQESAYFTTIDMSWGFYQLPMEPKSQNYTAFSTPFGSFQWLRMPMGLTRSPNTFQSLMEHLLVGLTWNITVPYLDDCIIFSKTPEEHIKRLQQVFQRFREANLKINPTKCAFFQTKVQFLGHVISRNGLEADPGKVKAVQNFPVPQNQTDVKSFLGLCSYYRRYIKNFATIARPLHKASETKSSFNWTEETQEAFEKLKKHLSSTPILAFPDVKEPFILYTDASLTAMGAVLAQVQDGKERAICYASKAFSKSRTNYSATKRELLASVTFTRHFKHYLLGRKFKIVTDHRALQWLHNFKDPDGLTARWLEKLAAFDYEVQHRPGKSIGHADGLSRIPIVNQVTTSSSTEKPDEPMKTIFFELIHKNGNLFESKDSLAHCISSDFKMSAGNARSFKRNFPYNFPESTNSPLFVQQVDDRFIYHLVTKKRFFQKPTYNSLRRSLEAMTQHANKHKVTEISMPKAGCGLDRLEWYKVERLIGEICAQSNFTITVYDQNKDEQSQKQTEAPVRSALGQAQRQDEALSKLIEWIQKGKVPTSQELQGLPRLAWQLNNQLKSLQLLDGILCRKFETADNQVVLQQIVPPSMTQEILSACLSSPTAGHLGVAKTSE